MAEAGTHTAAGRRMAAFAQQLHRSLPAGGAGAGGAGFFTSPLSVYVALALALNGAGPDSATQQELYHLLNQDKNRLLGLLPPKAAGDGEVQALLQELAGLSASLLQQQQQQQGSTGAELIVANGLWTNKVKLLPEYEASARSLFQAEAREVDGVAPINEWAARATRGLITTCVPPGTPFQLVLTNALYFKGLWELRFSKEATRKAPFKLEGGGEAQVDMMSKSFAASDLQTPNARRLAYLQAERYGAVRLPYKGSSISAVVALPAEGLRVAEALGELDFAELADTSKFRRVGPQGLQIKLPRFKVKTECVSLKEPLSRLGVRAAFGPANFGRLSEEPLRISDVLQSVVVEVDEEGTEAAAVTAVAMMRCAMMPGAPPPSFTFDRPFVFMLVDDGSGVPLFVGTVTDPSRGA